MVRKVRLRILKSINIGRLGMRPTARFIVVGNVNGKATIKNFRLKKEAQAFIRRKKGKK